MKGMTAFACMSDLDLDLIEESMGLFTPAAVPAVRVRRTGTALSRFFGSGWGVAVICAAVSLSVMVAIVLAGRGGWVTPPDVGTEEPESHETVYESESGDVTHEPTEESAPTGETEPEEPTGADSEAVSGEDSEEGTTEVTEAVTEEDTEAVTEGVFYPDAIEGGVLFISNGDGTCRIKGADKTYKGSITVPEVSPYGERVTTVATGAFRGFTEITEVILPDSVTVIKGSAFQGCGSLVHVDLPPEVTEFGRAMFDRCGELLEVVLPKGLTSIDMMTFQTCVNLRRVVAQEGITSIGANAFNGCRSLHELTLPAGLESIGSAAFMNCCGLQTIYYGGRLSEWQDVEIHEYENAHLGHAQIVSGSN